MFVVRVVQTISVMKMCVSRLQLRACTAPLERGNLRRNARELELFGGTRLIDLPRVAVVAFHPYGKHVPVPACFARSLKVLKVIVETFKISRHSFPQ